MKFYHGTNQKAWEEIQKEGILFGIHSYRYTYLSPNINIARDFGRGIVLEVEYTPVGNLNKATGKVVDNYTFRPPTHLVETIRDGAELPYCWQFSVFVPIDICNVRKLTEEETDHISKEWDVDKWNKSIGEWLKDHDV